MKITLIGAGSVVFAKNLIGDILQFPELSDCTLCLMDIDPDRLKVAEIMANRMVAALKVKAKVVATLDRRAAIRGARYVICTVQVGGYKPGTVIDFEIPRKYGLLQTIGDTLGVGGVFRALRTIPVVTAIAHDIAEVGAPGCLLLNYSNPMAMLCSAVARDVGIPHVGLCHSVQGTSQQLASYAGLPFEDITFLVAGINHMAFFLKFEYRGQDAYPLLFDLIKRPNFGQDKVRFEMMRRTGYFVTESSEHQSEYVPYFIHHGEKIIDEFEVPIDEYLRRCIGVIESWEKTQADLLGSENGIVVGPQSHEYGSYIIHSRETNTPRVIYGNVPNTSLIDNLPLEACVEVPCLVDAQGIQPTRIGDLPPQLAALCQTNINVQTLTVEAALTRRREHIYHAVMLDPHTATVLTLDKIWAMCDELIAAHQKVGLLGEYAATIPNTGRAWAGTGDRPVIQAALAPKKAKPIAGKMDVEITATNPGARPLKTALRVRCETLAMPPTVLAEKTVQLSVPAGKTVRQSVALNSDLKEGFALRLSSSTTGLLLRDGLFVERRKLVAGPDGAAPFALKLAGFPAAEGSLSLVGDRLRMKLAVDDSKIAPGGEPWNGSGIEFFLAEPSGGNLRQLFLVPQTGARAVKLLDRQFRPLKGATARIRPHRRGTGYELDVELPNSLADVTPGKPFLFDIIVGLTALGDAHSGGRTSLSGGFDSSVNSGLYHQVEL